MGRSSIYKLTAGLNADGDIIGDILNLIYDIGRK
jgi:hypothetical protein